jgi:hypothetical protein
MVGLEIWHAFSVNIRAMLTNKDGANCPGFFYRTAPNWLITYAGLYLNDG